MPSPRRCAGWPSSPRWGVPVGYPAPASFDWPACPLIVYTVATDIVTAVAVFHTAMDLRQAIADRDAEIER